MTAIVAGQGLGLLNTSQGLLGTSGQVGGASQGRAGDKVYVNASTGNLVVQQDDEWLVGAGPDAVVKRTYNSAATNTDDNGDNWRLGLSRRIYGLSGTFNTAGSTVKRVGEDGAETVYSYDGGQGAYVSKDGAGSFDRLTYNSTNLTWSWVDGDTQTAEVYNVVSGTDARLGTITDLDGNKITLTYANSTSYLITQIATTARDAGTQEVVTLAYYAEQGKTSNLKSMSTSYYEGTALKTIKRVEYTYDTYNRLETVKVDLTHTDTTDAIVYTTTYAYEGTSTRLASISQTDKSKVEFVYGNGKVTEIRQTVDSSTLLTTKLDYTVPGTTKVTDAMGLVTELIYETAAGQNYGQLKSIRQPGVGGTAKVTGFTYDASGNVETMTDARGNQTVFRYDTNGNRTYERSAAGEVIERLFSTSNLLLKETTYTMADSDGDGAAQPSGARITRYVYNAKGHLRFEITPEGRVTQYAYNPLGQLTQKDAYGDTFFDTSTLGASNPTESAMTTWASGRNLALSTRTNYTYNSRGQIDRVSEYATIGSTGTLSTAQTVQYVYDQAGNLLSRADERGHKSVYCYDGLNRVTRTDDPMGNQTITEHIDSSGISYTTEPNGLVTTSFYDRAGRLIRTQRYSDADQFGIAYYKYDALNRKVSYTNELGEVTYYLYDEAGRQVGEVDPTGALTQYYYNGNDDLIQTRRWANKVSSSMLTALAANPASATLPANLLSNDLSGWTRGVDGSATNFGNGLNLNSTSQLAGEPTAWLRQNGTEAISSYLSSSSVNVTAGNRYEVSAYTGALRATATLEVVFLNSSNLQIGSAAVPIGGVVSNASEAGGGSNLSGYKRLWGFVTAPTGAVTAKVRVRKAPTTAANTDSYIFVTHAYMGGGDRSADHGHRHGHPPRRQPH